MKHAPAYLYVCHLWVHVYTNLTAVTVGFTELTNSVDETDETTTLECTVTVTGQLERDLLININTENGTATGQWFTSGRTSGRRLDASSIWQVVFLLRIHVHVCGFAFHTHHSYKCRCTHTVHVSILNHPHAGYCCFH